MLRQVANAARVNASAVLIYPDLDDFSFEESEDTTDLFGHVSERTRRKVLKGESVFVNLLAAGRVLSQLVDLSLRPRSTGPHGLG